MIFQTVTRPQESIAARLFKKVFFIYILIAAIITFLHLFLEYGRVKDEVISELDISAETIAKPLGVAVWDADREQVSSLMDGLQLNRAITGLCVVEIGSECDEFRGTVPKREELAEVVEKGRTRLVGKGGSKGVFGYRYPIRYVESSSPEPMGQLVLFSSKFLLFDMMKYQVYYILLIALIKAVVLWLGFIWFSKRLLTRPLVELATEASGMNMDNLHPLALDMGDKGQTELSVLHTAFNTMIANLKQGVQARKVLYEELDQYKNNLETLVDKRTDELLEANKRLGEHSRILEKSRNEILVFDADDLAILLVNGGARINLGFNEEELLGLSFTDILHDMDPAQFRTRAAGLTNQEKELIVYETVHRRKDGTTYPVETRLQLMEFSHHTVFVSIALDISEKKVLEEQLRHSQKMEAIGTLAGGIAHDFNNLLLGVQGRASLAMSTLDKGDPLYLSLVEIEEYVGKAKNLTGQLLGIARGGRYNPRPVNLGELVEKSAGMFGRTRKEIDITTQIIDADVVVEVDNVQIDQVLLNLFLNAAQAMPGGGTIRLAIRKTYLAPEKTGEYELEAGWYGMVEVEDSGCGMDGETLVRIFNPFFTTKELERGTGLGLASAYGIVKNHNGFITVKSEPGAGSLFTLFLPCSDRAVEKEREIALDSRSGEGRILLVDDEQIILDVAGTMITELGFEVVAAEGGDRAVQILKEDKLGFDLVILDLIMPGMDGGATFAAIRGMQPEQAVLISSGYAKDSKASELLEQGAVGFIQKPFGLAELSRQLQEALVRVTHN